MARRPRRGRPPATDAERKDRLIQTRVDEELDDVLRAEAKRQRTTVSQLIRHVLADTFQLVDDIVAETANLTDTVRRDAKKLAASATGLGRSVGDAAMAAKRAATLGATAPAVVTSTPAAPAAPAVDLDSVLAWQEVTMGREQACASCARAIAKGERAFMGVGDDASAPRPWLCAACQAAR